MKLGEGAMKDFSWSTVVAQFRRRLGSWASSPLTRKIPRGRPIGLALPLLIGRRRVQGVRDAAGPLSGRRFLGEGQAAGLFRSVNLVLAYMSTVGPLLLNAARERAARQPGRGQLPMFVEVSHADLASHMQQVARRMLLVNP